MILQIIGQLLHDMKVEYCQTEPKKIVFAPGKIYGILPKYWDTLMPYLMCHTIWTNAFYYLLIVSKNCWMSGKQCRVWSDATFSGIWSGSTLYALVCLSKYWEHIHYDSILILHYLRGLHKNSSNYWQRKAFGFISRLHFSCVPSKKYL